MTASDDQFADALNQQLLKNSVLMVVARAASMLTLLISVPCIVAYLGLEGYGVWESILAISGIIIVLQTVIRDTILWYISRCYGQRNPRQARRVIRIGVGAIVFLTIIVAPAAWCFRDAILSQLQIPHRWVSQARWIFPLVVNIALLSGINQALIALISGYQRSGLAALIHAGGIVATHVVAIALLIVGYGLAAMLFGILFGFILMFAALMVVAAALCGRVSLIPAWPSTTEACLLGPFVGLLLLSNLSYILRDHTDKLILAATVSPETTGFFCMAQRLASLVTHAHVVLAAPFTAAIGALHVRRNWAGIEKMHAQIGMWMAALAGMAGFLICTLRSPLFICWIGKDIPEAHGFLALLLFGVCSAIIFGGAAVPLAKGLGRPGLETCYTLVTLGLILFLKPLLVIAFGGYGAVGSSAVGWAIGSLFMLVLVHQKLDLSQSSVFRSLGIFSVTLILSAIGWSLSQDFQWPSARLNAMIVGFVTGIALAVFYLAVLIGLKLVEQPRMKAFRVFQLRSLSWRRT